LNLLTQIKNTTTLHKQEDKKVQHETDNAKEDNPGVQHELSEANKLIEKLLYERENAKKEVEELRMLNKENPRSQLVGYFAEFRYSELEGATSNFHKSFKLGEGGFGLVYKGILHKTAVAIKILKEGSSQGAKELNQEVFHTFNPLHKS
jgi:hypothetical protein